MQINSLIGKKTEQLQGFLQDGKRVPLTVVQMSGNFITQIKKLDKEGYNSLQLGIETKKKARKSIVNHGKKAGLKNTPRFFREIRVEDTEGATLGAEVNIKEVFTAGDLIDVTGVSKGKGFAGGVKRHGFHGGPKTHGQSDRHRAPGSIGQGTTPGRVYKGKRMAGRMGSDTVTLKNLEIIEVKEDGAVLIKGLIPGGVNSIVVVKKVGTNAKFVPLYKEEVEVEGSEEPVVEEALTEETPAEEAKTEAAAEVSTTEPAEEAVPVVSEPVVAEAEVQTEEKKEEGN